MEQEDKAIHTNGAVHNGADHIKEAITEVSTVEADADLDEDTDVARRPRWQPVGAMGHGEMYLKVEQMIHDGATPLQVLRHICPDIEEIPSDWSDDHPMIMAFLQQLLDKPAKREKLAQYNTFADAIELFRTSKRILMLTGAGVSVSCGIPDFRSKHGIYARLHNDFPDLPDPSAMFDIQYFRKNPDPFFNFAKEIFPGQFEPSISHKFIRALESNGQLLRNYTQNIDTLEMQTGIQKVVECHGSFSKATCMECLGKFDGSIIKEDVMMQRVARCPHCKVGVIKPDIVFFGEDLGDEFHYRMAEDKDKVDLVVVIGSSLKVRPVALIPFSVSPDVPQILINREPVSGYTADIELLGNCDDVIRDICLALGGSFHQMLHDHESAVATRSGATMLDRNWERRKILQHTSFCEILDQMGMMEMAEDERESEALDGETAKKRPRLDGMFQRKLISVEEALPADVYVQLIPNRALFPGAELVYDLDDRIFIGKPRVQLDCGRQDCPDSDSDEDDMDEDALLGPGTPLSSTQSVVYSTQADAVREAFSERKRTESCSTQLDVEARLPAERAREIVASWRDTEDETEDDSDEREEDEGSSKPLRPRQQSPECDWAAGI